MSNFNKITKTGVGIMLFGLVVGCSGIVVGIIGVNQQGNTLNNLMLESVLVMWLLWAVGAVVGFAGIFYKYWR